MGQSIQNQKFRLRISYKKIGCLAFISHLELIRSIESIVRRSGLPYCVSQGFSPHMKISFGPALGVGIESQKQIFDLYIKEYIKVEQVLCALKKASEGSLEVFDCKYIDNTEDAPSAVFGPVNYSVLIDQKIGSLDVPKQIKTIKKGKEKLIETGDYLLGDVEIKNEGQNSEIHFCLETKNTGSLKPELFVNELLKNSGLDSAKIINFKII